ncbi:PEP-CTERM sorting domain-containing protein [Cerasicoccus frondis]|uniref:PEP-CTERM sorting domain-containing protein n=1 Tax=Cerasicoccus frondis TaxID=490090 RepID=UPI0028524BCC|nr:PEP-CTERM sorting domain-containing protein [Cerasicoccus frondis]
MYNKLHQHVLLLAGVSILTTSAHAVLNPISLPGVNESYSWSFTKANYSSADYGSADDWSALSTSSSGDSSVFIEPSAVGSNYMPSSGAPLNGLLGYGGSLILSDTSPLTGLETIVFQLDYAMIGDGFAPGSSALNPVLKIGGVLFGVDGQADYSSAEDVSDAPHPHATFADFGYTANAGTYAWQWDLSDLAGYDISSGFTIEWSSPGALGGISDNALLSGVQLDQGNQFSQVVVPEPSTYATLLGAGILGFAIWRRRK